MIALDAVVEKYPHISKIGDDGILELYLDNTLLSAFRTCESYFAERHVHGLVPRGSAGKSFFLDFGIWFHKVMEFIDTKIIKGEDINNYEILSYATKMWSELSLGSYDGDKDSDKIGGLAGGLDTISAYLVNAGPQTPGFRWMKIIATELMFGYNREAPLVSEYPVSTQIVLNNSFSSKYYNYRAYLVGRPDVTVETALGIGPKDYKTTSRIEKAREMYKPSEQLTGYVYGINQIFSRSIENTGKICRTAYLVAISKKSTKNPKDRVSVIPYTYSNKDLEQYRRRQQVTCDKIYEVLVLGRDTDWNTSTCTNMNFKNCPYHKLHSTTHDAREAVISQFYDRNFAWNPATRGETKEIEEITE